jgi:eukaryotic-like serine/threonine-protein kinase
MSNSVVAKVAEPHLERARLIDRICDRFEAAWQSGRRPRLERYLALAPRSWRAQLFGEILFLELTYRARRGQEPEPEEYLGRFSRYSRSVRAVFDQAGLASRLGQAVKAASGEGQPPDSRATAPDQLGDYELLDKLGQGGMGIVYRARQRSADRIVALKVMRSDRLESLTARERQEWLERFRREARIAARVEHPGAANVYEVGEISGRFYYSMRYVEGRSLAEILREGPIACKQAAACLEGVARAVGAIHALGIVHRDLKPRNILVDAAGQPFVTDFGLARWLAGGNDITNSRAWLGTPSYMAPEQAQDPARAAAPSDVYSLGATLYELLTGRPPFRAADPLETLRQVISEEPVPPRRLNPAIDRDLELICLKCLQKEPDRRYASAGQLAEELQRYRNREPLRHTRPIGKTARLWRWSRRNPALAGLALVASALLVTLVVGSMLFSIQSARAGQRLEAANLETRRQAASWALDWGVRLCEGSECDQGVLWLARALEIAPADATDLQWNIRTNLGGWQPQVNCIKGSLVNTGEVMSVAFSPDGPQALTADENGGPCLWNVAVGTMVRLPTEHPGVVKAAFSADGLSVLTAGPDSAARQWQVGSGRPLGPELQHSGKVCVVTSSPDGSLIATGSMDGTAHVWDAHTGRPLGHPLSHKGPVAALAFSPDGKTLLTGSMDGTARLWDTHTGRATVRPLEHGGKVLAVAFSRDGNTALTGSTDWTARLWNARTGQPAAPPLHHQGGVRAVAFSPDGKAVLIGSADRTARLWSARDGTPLGIPIPHHDEVLTVAFSGDGQWFLTGSSDGLARLWWTESQLPLGSPLRHAGAVRRVALSRDGTKVLTGSTDQRVRLWEVARGGLLRASLHQDIDVFAVAFSPDGKTILTGGFDATARLWDSATAQPLGAPLRPGSRVYCAAFNPNGQTFVTGGTSGARLWQTAQGKPLGAPFCPGEWIHSVAFSPDGKVLATGSDAHKALLFDAANGKPIGRPLNHEGAVFAVAFSPDSRSVLTGSSDNTAQIWDAATGRRAASPLLHGGWVETVGFSPDGTLVLTGSRDNTARVWDAATGQLLRELRHNDQVQSVAFSPDGQTILTASADRTAQLWETATGKPLGPPLQHQGKVYAAAFSPDGRLAATGSADGTARLWDVLLSKPVGPRLIHPFAVHRVVFSPDATTLLTAGLDQNARLWNVPRPLAGDVEEITDAVQARTGSELLPSGAFHELDPGSWQERRGRLKKLAAVGFYQD